MRIARADAIITASSQISTKESEIRLFPVGSGALMRAGLRYGCRIPGSLRNAKSGRKYVEDVNVIQSE
jgi:hypothetical protein